MNIVKLYLHKLTSHSNNNYLNDGFDFGYDKFALSVSNTNTFIDPDNNLIAHDIIDHQNGVDNIGNTWDEEQALGAIQFKEYFDKEPVVSIFDNEYLNFNHYFRYNIKIPETVNNLQSALISGFLKAKKRFHTPENMNRYYSNIAKCVRIFSENNAFHKSDIFQLRYDENTAIID